MLTLKSPLGPSMTLRPIPKVDGYWHLRIEAPWHRNRGTIIMEARIDMTDKDMEKLRDEIENELKKFKRRQCGLG